MTALCIALGLRGLAFVSAIVAMTAILYPLARFLRSAVVPPKLERSRPKPVLHPAKRLDKRTCPEHARSVSRACVARGE